MSEEPIVKMKTMRRTFVRLQPIALLAATLALATTACVAFRVESSEQVTQRMRVESSEQVTQRMLDFFKIPEGPTAWVMKMAGPVDPGADFTGVWRNPEDGFQVTIQQVGNLLYVLKAGEKHSDTWSIHGSTAYCCGFGSRTIGGQVINVFSVWRATLLNPNTMQWNIEQGVVASAFAPIERTTRVWNFNRIRNE